MAGKSRKGELVRMVPTEVSRMPGDPVEIYNGLTRLEADCMKLMTFCMGRKNEEGRWTRPPDTKGWAMAIREMRGCLDQQARMVGAYDSPDPRLQNAFVEEFIKAVTKALADHPEARQIVVAAIDELEAGK